MRVHVAAAVRHGLRYDAGCVCVGYWGVSCVWWWGGAYPLGCKSSACGVHAVEGIGKRAAGLPNSVLRAGGSSGATRHFITSCNTISRWGSPVDAPCQRSGTDGADGRCVNQFQPVDQSLGTGEFGAVRRGPQHHQRNGQQPSKFPSPTSGTTSRLPKQTCKQVGR